MNLKNLKKDFNLYFKEKTDIDIYEVDDNKQMLVIMIQQIEVISVTFKNENKKKIYKLLVKLFEIFEYNQKLEFNNINELEDFINNYGPVKLEDGSTFTF